MKKTHEFEMVLPRGVVLPDKKILPLSSKTRSPKKRFGLHPVFKLRMDGKIGI